MRPILTIDDFSYGIINDSTIPAKNGFSSCVGIDIHTNDGYLCASRKMVKDGESTVVVISDAPYWIERYTENTNCPYYALPTNGKLYGRITDVIGTSDKWIRIHANVDSSAGNGGLKSFGNTLYYASDGYLGRTINVTLSQDATASTTELHLTGVFPSARSGDGAYGYILLEKEVITYTGIDRDQNMVTGCLRGRNGTVEATHSSGATVMGFDDTYKTFLAADNKWHPMEEYLGKLNVGDGRYIATLDGDQTFVNNALTLPVGFRSSSLGIYGDELTIGTYKGTNFWDYPDSQLFTWDGVSSLPNKSINIRDGGVTSTEVWKNNLIVFAGVRGNIYQFDGSNLQKLKTIPNIIETGLAQVYPGATSVVDGNLLFGLSGSRSDCLPGIYSLGQDAQGSPIALTLKHVGSSGVLTSASALNINSIYPFSSYGQFYAGINDNGADDVYQINYLDSSSKIPSGAYWESQIYEIPRDNHSRLLRGVETVMENTDGTLTIKYKIDNNSSWTTLGETDYQNQLIRGIDQRAKTIQLRLEFECNGDTTPKVKTIKIY